MVHVKVPFMYLFHLSSINDLPIIINTAKVYVCADGNCVGFQADSTLTLLNEALNTNIDTLGT